MKKQKEKKINKIINKDTSLLLGGSVKILQEHYGGEWSVLLEFSFPWGMFSKT